MLNKLKQLAEQWLNKEAPNPEFTNCNFEQLSYGLRPGDVILVEGRSRVSEVIKLITQSRWTHAALYIGRLHDIQDPKAREQLLAAGCEDGPTQWMIEGLLGQGTIVNPLSIYQQDNLRICRPAQLSHDDAQKVIQYAIDRLGTPYNVRQLLDLARLMFPWTIVPRRWRSSLFRHHAGEPTRTVCSSMLAEAFATVQYPVLPSFRTLGKGRVELIKRNTNLFVPADFDYSPYFKIIKFPFWGDKDKPSYRQLPWNQDGLLANDDDSLSIERAK
ncbi:YiiX/YebB-like N1pC/P60 family cysteine hydrolase [Pleionea sp. CnH1-48]|uniref:YiiX/YebB-like N1pC/P60 family cysteine hydrolase n=1 Tax=Pleionea sp. CnH1-48 TaxID=2954494 RepID=UPI002096AB5B|nr:YiiX/YebB-like N1pC/P60 family cysteine hydrolase [Pleionea sp. CnH1-48]MCO7225879.1 hypothetical protein [Pleionea sp. CnH1-48]